MPAPPSPIPKRQLLLHGRTSRHPCRHEVMQSGWIRPGVPSHACHSNEFRSERRSEWSSQHGNADAGRSPLTLPSSSRVQRRPVGRLFLATCRRIQAFASPSTLYVLKSWKATPPNAPTASPQRDGVTVFASTFSNTSANSQNYRARARLSIGRPRDVLPQIHSGHASRRNSFPQPHEADRPQRAGPSGSTPNPYVASRPH